MKTLLTTISILLIATAVYAGQTISVKYRNTPVDLNYFEPHKTSLFSWVKGVWYDGRKII